MEIETEKRWILKDQPDNNIVEFLSKEIGINAYLANLIAQRDIKTFEEARKYFNPTKEELHDPFLMKGMQKAIERIHKAIKTGEKIMFYGDYDVDGTTSVSLLYNYFSKIYSNIEYYVPDRFKEGYGVSSTGIKYIIENGFKLLVTIDCGIKEIENVGMAKEVGIDVIVCDHHTPGLILPPALAILNPKQSDCKYPYKELSGCGIGFKLIQAYSNYYKTGIDPFEYIDLVVVSIASDIVPITGENRVLAFLGLEKINNNPSYPFEIMLESLEVTKNLSITDLVFIIGPRLNASGRISHAKTTVEFLTSTDSKHINQYLNDINTKNTERKELDKNIAEEAVEMIKNDNNLLNRKTTVLWDPEWHKGVIGIVASRLIETFYRPTILFSENEGLLTGSGRSVAGFNLYKAIESCKHLLNKFGGHQFAAGLVMDKENFDAFSEEFEKVVSETIKDEELIPAIEYDLELPLEYINSKFIKSIERFGPFGPDNMKPRFVTRNVLLKYPPKKVGGDHLKLSVYSRKGSLDAIGFNMGEFFDKLDTTHPFDICYVVEINSWNGQEKPQLQLRDIKLK
jgi:single-stranded-DNA-specific exonuclease